MVSHRGSNDPSALGCSSHKVNLLESAYFAGRFFFRLFGFLLIEGFPRQQRAVRPVPLERPAASPIRLDSQNSSLSCSSLNSDALSYNDLLRPLFPAHQRFRLHGQIFEYFVLCPLVLITKLPSLDPLRNRWGSLVVLREQGATDRRKRPPSVRQVPSALT